MYFKIQARLAGVPEGVDFQCTEQASGYDPVFSSLNPDGSGTLYQRGSDPVYLTSEEVSEAKRLFQYAEDSYRYAGYVPPSSDTFQLHVKASGQGNFGDWVFSRKGSKSRIGGCHYFPHF